MQGIHHQSTLLREPKVLQDRKVSTGRGMKTVKSAIPAHQATVHRQQNVYYTQDFNGVPTNLFRNNGSRYSGHIEAKSFTKMKAATLRVSLQVTPGTGDGATLAPMPLWFDRIEIRTGSGSKHLTTIYGDQLLGNLNLLENDRLASVKRNANISDDWSSGRELSDTRARTFYLPLLGSFFDSEQYWADIRGDVVVDVFPANTIVSAASAASVTVDCTDMSLVIQTENLSSEDARSHEHFHSSVISSNRSVEWVPVREFGRTMTAGTQVNVDLDNVVGECAGLVCMVRQTGATNTGNGRFQYIDLGADARIDLVTAGNKSLLGSGVPLDGDFVRNELWPTHFNTDWNKHKNAVFVPFTSDIKAAYKGVVDGAVTFNGSGIKLQVTPGAAGVDTVQVAENTSVTPATNGLFYIEFKGQASVVMLGSAATAGSLSLVFDELETAQNYPGGPLTAQFSQAPGQGGGPIEVTFPGRYVPEPLRIVSVNLETATAEPVAYSTRVGSIRNTNCVVGTDGFVNGSYDVDVYALMYKTVHTKDGIISSETY